MYFNEALIQVGNSAPDFKFKMDEKLHFGLSYIKPTGALYRKKSEIREKIEYLVLDFLGTWCQPNIKGFLKMKKYLEKYPEKLCYISIACNEKSLKAWKNYSEKIMKTTNTIIALLIPAIFMACSQKQAKEKDQPTKNNAEYTMSATWLRMSPQGPVKMQFKENGKATIDFGNDQSVEVTSTYTINGDTIKFTDENGQMCPAPGTYLMDETPYYMAFDVLNDTCNGRIKTTTGFWTKPNFRELLDTLDKQIAARNEAELNLMRGRLYMATGNSVKARADFDKYIATDSTNFRVFTNRAATQFPTDMEGALADCESAIALNPEYKNAWFLRGLALYEMGRKEEACESFSRAIELGFSVLRRAEKQKCAAFWSIEDKS